MSGEDYVQTAEQIRELLEGLGSRVDVITACAYYVGFRCGSSEHPGDAIRQARTIVEFAADKGKIVPCKPWRGGSIDALHYEFDPAGRYVHVDFKESAVAARADQVRLALVPLAKQVSQSDVLSACAYMIGHEIGSMAHSYANDAAAIVDSFYALISRTAKRTARWLKRKQSGGGQTT